MRITRNYVLVWATKLGLAENSSPRICPINAEDDGRLQSEEYILAQDTRVRQKELTSLVIRSYVSSRDRFE